MNIGTAPAWMTTRVWWDVPEAMLVNTHAASNYNDIQNIWRKLVHWTHNTCNFLDTMVKQEESTLQTNMRGEKKQKSTSFKYNLKLVF